MLQWGQSSLFTQGLVPLDLSLHLAQCVCLSSPAINCPQAPRFCPGETIMINKLLEVVGSKIKLILLRHNSLPYGTECYLGKQQGSQPTTKKNGRLVLTESRS